MADERKLEAVKELAAYRVAKEKFVEEMDWRNGAGTYQERGKVVPYVK